MAWLKRLLAKLPCQEIGDGRGSVFFYRYTLWKTRRFAVYLHQFLRSDSDRCLHDHPWSFVAVILRGGYWEHVEYDDFPFPRGQDRQWRRPGSILFRPAEFAHRIELDPVKPQPWSLVFVGRKRRRWGFYGPRGWVAWIPGYSPICETKGD